jgi:CspA family cold shock protein
MSNTGFFAVLAMAAALAFVSWLIDLTLYLPVPLANFALALLSGVIALTMTRPDKPAQTVQQQTGTAGSQGKERGKVKWFSSKKGFGFITRQNGDEIFVHFRSIMGDGHRILKEGQQVEFQVGRNDKGLQAEDVVALN